MSTKIDLEYPYNKDWKLGYLVKNGEERRTVILYNSHKDRSSTAYARYLVSTSLGRYLSKEEQVDHIDNDKTNDQITNLQILLPLANSQKEAKRRGKLVVEMLCHSCGAVFQRRRGNSCRIPSKKGRIFSCTPTCSSALLKKNLSEEEKEVIRDNQFVSEFRLHE